MYKSDERPYDIEMEIYNYKHRMQISDNYLKQTRIM